MFSLTIDGREALALTNAIRRLPRALRKEVSDALRRSARDVARRTRTILRQGRSARGALPAGAPPRRKTGALARSIRVRRGRGGLFYEVRADRPYARALEIGAETGGRRTTQRIAGRRRSVRQGGRERMPPHPFLTVALAQESERTEREVAAAIRGVLAKVARAR